VRIVVFLVDRKVKTRVASKTKPYRFLVDVHVDDGGTGDDPSRSSTRWPLPPSL